MSPPSLRLPIVAGITQIVPSNDQALDILRRGEKVGTVSTEVDKDRLTIVSLCVHDALRGYGAGSAAARALVREAGAAGFATVRAWAPPDRGLAVYFWFRMGLRPLPGPGPDEGIWLQRDLTRPVSASSGPVA